MGKIYDFILKKYANTRTFKTAELYCGIVARSKIDEDLDDFGKMRPARLYRPYKFVIMQEANYDERQSYLIDTFGETRFFAPDLDGIPMEFSCGNYYKVPSLNNAIIPYPSDMFQLSDKDALPQFMDVICSRVIPLTSINTNNIHLSPKLSLNEIKDIESLINSTYELNDILSPAD